ncbi:hypothetical protein TNCV_3477041 [Trichonephila clavipes]|nr:hypothetical protein TNCV_3477041 [Trichonephila clavipes]
MKVSKTANVLSVRRLTVPLKTSNRFLRRVCKPIVPCMLNEDQSADEVKSASQTELKDMAKNGFQKCVDDFNNRWRNCVVAQGSYFEGRCILAV